MKTVAEDNRPLYPISVAAELLSVHPRTLRLYEYYGLARPKRRGNKRFFSNNDLRWIRCIREMIHEKGLNISGIQKLLEVVPCWHVKECDLKQRSNCTAYHDNTAPCWVLAKKLCSKKTESCKQCSTFLRRNDNDAKKHDHA